MTPTEDPPITEDAQEDPEEEKEGAGAQWPSNGGPPLEEQPPDNQPDDNKGYTPPPKNLPAFPDAQVAKRKNERKRWKDSDGRIYEWDSQHGKVEIYDKSGKKHLGEYDPNTGEQTKPPDPGRKTEK
ncbi:MAG: hypothetical protein H6858_04720 [Rhodospirillales bacterium]|nr:hypothetical protein [Alphaproteobacteria bacterium]MCB9976889.1 hypothetical protein [Rhodospirillales bacterium]